jgi:hypothetical protein
MPTPSVPVSWGELLDKMTILEIKRERIAAPAARRNVGREYQLLSIIGAEALKAPAVGALCRRLKRVNEELWRIEDAIREEEAAAQFGPAFVQLARSVYQMNDHRTAIKREINRVLESELVEEKSYASGLPAEMMHRQASNDGSAAGRSS